MKNDKKDALSIANIGRFQNIKLSQINDLDIFLLKNIVREYYKLTDTCSNSKKKLYADLRVIFPNYNTAFSYPTSNTSLEILSNYQTPKSIIDTPKEDVIKILIEKSKKGSTWSEKVYSKLITIAKEANIIGVPLGGLSIKISNSLTLIKAFKSQIDNLLNEINTLIESSEFLESIKENFELINSIPGIEHLMAITLIGDINCFIKPKHLITFFGIDSSINQSGKFLGDQSKISIRGTRISQKSLYAVALASIKRNRNGIPIKKVLLEYYQVNLKGKKAKVTLAAIMHKVLNYIFAVLRNQTPFEMRDPKIHKQMFLENKHILNTA